MAAGLVAAAGHVACGDADVVHEVFDALPFHFVRSLLEESEGERLEAAALGPTQDPPTSASTPGPAAGAAAAAAVSVLVVVTQQPELACLPPVLHLLEPLSQIILHGRTASLVRDACLCVLAVARGSEAGMRACREQGVLGVAARSLAAITDPSCSALATDLLSVLVNAASPLDISQHGDSLAAAVPALARQLAFSEDSSSKHKIVTLLLALLSTTQQQQQNHRPALPSTTQSTAEQEQGLVQQGLKSLEPLVAGRVWAADLRGGIQSILLSTTG
ncbi:unnamed protein product [Closterium sp. Naga37s-1]|nr:unnamed protein product [Closterium sp. Naga37s-1]